MLKELKFVGSAVAKKDYLPALTHFVIEGGKVRGYNGSIALCAPVPFDINCKPKGDKLLQAIRQCSESIALTLTPTGKLSVKSGKFRALVECIEGETPHVEPEGNFFKIDGESMLKALKVLEPFVSDDASRPWSNGVLFRGQSAFATNNVIVTEYWTGQDMPMEINLPRHAVREMLRVDEPPVKAQGNDHSITLHYSDGRWIRSNLLMTDWPDLARILNNKSDQHPLPEELFAGVESVKQFADALGSVYFMDGAVVTSMTDLEGARYEVDGLGNVEGRYNADMLLKLQGVATSIDLSMYPRPVLFMGERLRGAIVGMKMPGNEQAV